MSCLICCRNEPEGIKPDGSERTFKPEGKFICSKCIAILCRMSQEELNGAYKKAAELGLEDKAETLKNLMEEEYHEPTKKHYTSKRLKRKRPVRTTGHDQKPNWRFKKKERPALHKAGATK